MVMMKKRKKKDRKDAYGVGVYLPVISERQMLRNRDVGVDELSNRLLIRELVCVVKEVFDDLECDISIGRP